MSVIVKNKLHSTEVVVAENLETYVNKIYSDRLSYIDDFIASNNAHFNSEDDVSEFLFESIFLFNTNQLIDSYKVNLNHYELETILLYREKVLDLHFIYFKNTSNFNYDNHLQSINAIVVLSHSIYVVRVLEDLSFESEENLISTVIKENIYNALIENVSRNETDTASLYKLSLILYASLTLYLATFLATQSKPKESAKAFFTLSEALFILKDGVADNIKSYIKQKMENANDARWKGHVEQLRRKYLELDEMRQGSSDKKLTIKAVAQWIYEHHNEQELEFETIRDHLSKARKGIFTND